MVCHIKELATNRSRFTQQYFTECFASLNDSSRTSKGNIIYPLVEIYILTVISAMFGNNTGLPLPNKVA